MLNTTIKEPSPVEEKLHWKLEGLYNQWICNSLVYPNFPGQIELYIGKIWTNLFLYEVVGIRTSLYLHETESTKTIF